MRTFFCFGLFLCFLLFACSKAPEEQNKKPEPEPKNCRLALILYRDNLESAGSEISYDVIYNGNQISELKSGKEESKFFYTGNGLLQAREDWITDYLGQHRIKYKYEFKYDSQSQITASLYSVSMDSGGTYLPLQLLTIDSITYKNNKPSVIKSFGYNSPSYGTIYQGKDSLVWTNGDLTERYLFDQRGLACSATFTYDLSKETRFDSLFTNFMFQDRSHVGDYGLIALRGSKHAITNGATCYSSPAGRNYVFKFNDNGYVESISNGQFYLYRFSYKCD